MGRRRDPDPRPEVEVLGFEPAPSEVQRVEVAPAQRSRKRGALIALTVAGLLGVGAALDGPDEDPEEPAEAARPEPTTTRPRRATTSRPSSTTTSTLAPVGPVLGQPTGGSILVLDDGGDWTWIDLDTGNRGEVALRALIDPYGVVPVTGGLVGIEQPALQASYRTIPGGAAVPLGRAEQVLGSGRPDRVWLLSSSPPAVDSLSARLVDLAGNQLMAFDIPAHWVQGGGFGSGVPFVAGGRVFLAVEGGPRVVAQGELIGTAAGAVVVLTCDDEARCAPMRVDVETGQAVELDVRGSLVNGYGVVPSASGDIALLTYGPEATSMTWFDRDGRRLGGGELEPSDQQGMAWLPGDLGMLVRTGAGFGRAHLVGEEIVVDPVPGLPSGVEASFLINP